MCKAWRFASGNDPQDSTGLRGRSNGHHTDKGVVQCFKDGRTSVESEARSGRPSISRNEIVIDQVRILVMQDRRITIRKLADEASISIGSVHFILTEGLGFRRISARVKAANDRAEATAFGDCIGHVGDCEQ